MEGIPVPVTAVEADDAVISGTYCGRFVLCPHKQLHLIFGLTEIAGAESFDDEDIVQIVTVLTSRLARERLESVILSPSWVRDADCCGLGEPSTGMSWRCFHSRVLAHKRWAGFSLVPTATTREIQA